MKKDAIVKFYLNFRLYIFPAVVAISSLILILFVIYPQAVKLIKNQRVASDLAKRHQFLETKASTLGSLDEGDLSNKLEFVLAAFPVERDFNNILGLLQKIASQKGFNITLLAVQQSSQVSLQESYTTRLEIVGPKERLKDFISAIESSVRIMKVGTIEISATKQGDIINATITVEVLYAAAPQTFGSVDSPLPNFTKNDEELISKLTTGTVTVTPPTTFPVSSRGKSNPFE